ncbi:MAG: glycogen synthase [Propionibacteriaceae bacterium]|nr:glycogen synthase [Propionibacteriaceae bacterium]
MHVSVLTREYPPFIYGGAGVHVGQLVPHLANLAEVDVQCMGEPRVGATAHAETFPPGANASLRVFGADLAMVAGVPEGTDVVHSHTWYANLAGHLAGTYLGVPHVVTAHSLEPLRPWKRDQLGGGYELSSWAERTAYEGASAIIAVSSAMRDDVLACYPNLDPAKVHVVLNGVDTDEFFPDAGTDYLSGLGVDLDRPSVVFVGRITKQKGLVHLLRAAREFDDCQILLLASSPDTPEIAAEFATALAELREVKGDDVIWVKEMAPRSGLRQVLSHARVFACPSIYEPLGIVNLEAMACEAAVVASGVGGIPEVVTAGETGLLVDYQPELASGAGGAAGAAAYVAEFEHRFALSVNELLADERKARAFGVAGRQRAIEHFSWEAIAAQTLEVYELALKYYGRLRK